MNEQEFKELNNLIDTAIEGSLATNDDELYADAQSNIKRIYELLKKVVIL